MKSVTLCPLRLGLVNGRWGIVARPPVEPTFWDNWGSIPAFFLLAGMGIRMLKLEQLL